jgi:FixJ family two-component response regulator
LKGTDTMENCIRNREITVLLVSDNTSDIQEVSKHLEKTMGLSCRIWHCPSITRSSGFFKKEIPGIDIVLLDLDLISSELPRDIFRHMQEIAGGIPIIVFTERSEHELALMVMEEGAADNVTRGQFSTDPYKLRDAIEFSLARNRIAKCSEQKNAKNIIYVGELGAVQLQTMKDQHHVMMQEAMSSASATLQEAIEHGNQELKEAGRASKIVLQDALESGKNDLRNAHEHRKGDDRRKVNGFGPIVHGFILEQRKGDRRETGRHAAANLRKAVENGANNLMDAKAVASAALKKFHEESAESHREKDQIIHWMSGGYSMEKATDTNF